MAELFKFRCSECQKLLGVSPRKVGRAVDCPQCGAGLIVPSPEEVESPALDDEAADFEELGIDLGFSSPLDIRPSERPTPPPDDRPPEEVEALAFLARAAEAPAPRPAALFAGFVPFPDPAPLDAAPDEDEDEDEAEPLIQTPAEPLTPRGARGRMREPIVDRRRDVVLPRTAVTAWALFAILALGFSFVAGLMIGHYRWK